MKKLLLFFVFLGTFSFAQVQEKSQIGAFYQLGYTAMRYQKSFENPGFNRIMDSLQTGGMAQELGLTYARRLTRELTFVGGLRIQNHRYNFLANSLPGVNTYQHILNYVGIPLGMEYNIITETWQPFVGVSVLSSKLVGSQVAYILQEGWNEVQTATYIPNTNWQFSAAVHMGAQLPVTLKWSIKPSLMLSYSLNSLGATNVPQRPYQLAFQLATLYNF
jgi:opacity protein-like surface antigen